MDKQLAILSIISSALLLVFAILFIMGLEHFGSTGQAIAVVQSCKVSATEHVVHLSNCAGKTAYILSGSLTTLHIVQDEQNLLPPPGSYIVISGKSVRLT